MSFSSTSEPITISKGVLSAHPKKQDNKTTVPASINLDDYIGFVDGKLAWGGKGFSSFAESVTITAGVLTAKFKTGSAKPVESKLDLNQHIKNSNGVLEIITRPPSVASPRKVDPIKTASASELLRAVSTGTASSAATSASASSLFSATSTTSSSTSFSASSTTTSKSSSSFRSSQFRGASKHLPIQETCTKLELRGTHLHVDCKRIDGSIAHSHIDLDEIIGFTNGGLAWDLKGFSKHCFEYALDGFFLVVKYRIHEGEHYHIARLDLCTRLRNADGILIIVELNKKLSVMLSEVPWMKFKVIAEPDLSVFAKHPVMQETLVRITETTVEHVTVEMHKQLTIAMEAAIAVITASAMRHVSEQLEIMVQDVVGCASASASITEAEHLHIYGRGGAVYGNGHGYANGHGSGHGHGHEVHAHRNRAGYSNGYEHSSSHIHEHSSAHSHEQHGYIQHAQSFSVKEGAVSVNSTKKAQIAHS